MGDWIDKIEEDPLLILETPRKSGERARIVVENIWDQVPVGGASMPREFTVIFWRTRDIEYERAPISAEFVVNDGEPFCLKAGVSTRPGGPRITTSDLREIKIEEMLDHAIEVLARDDYGSPEKWLYGSGQSAAARRKVNRSRLRVNDDFLRDVAKVYTANIASGTPAKAVADRYGRARRTASLWIKKAREAGYIDRLMKETDTDG